MLMALLRESSPSSPPDAFASLLGHCEELFVQRVKLAATAPAFYISLFDGFNEYLCSRVEISARTVSREPGLGRLTDQVPSRLGKLLYKGNKFCVYRQHVSSLPAHSTGARVR